MKQDKSINYNLLGRRNSDLEIGTNFVKVNQNLTKFWAPEDKKGYLSRNKMVCGLSFGFLSCIKENLKPGFHYKANATTTTQSKEIIRLSSHPSR